MTETAFVSDIRISDLFRYSIFGIRIYIYIKHGCSMSMDTLTFVIVGHVDHGKSTLIGRLLYDTGSLSPDKMEEIRQTSQELGRDTEFSYLLDHLQEERQQGITIETTQVFFKTEKRHYVIVDAPGHVEFVKNMITGASYAQAAVLIIDALEGVQEQTKRHAYILSLLGVQQIIMVINKMDLAGYRQEVFTTIKDQAAAFLASLGITSRQAIPIAALKGENITTLSQSMPWYSGVTFVEALDGLCLLEPATKQETIFPVQDVYKVADKRIIAGRLEAGTLSAGDEVTVLPHRQATRIASIEKFPGTVSAAAAGESIGIITADRVFTDRGDIITTTPQTVRFVESFHANIFWLAKRPFFKSERLLFKCATQAVACTIESITRRMNSSTLALIQTDADELGNLEVGEVIIKTKKPVAVKPFDAVQELGRFVLVREGNTCAGGIVTKAV